ncbi:hypothetical protein ACFPM0_01905 [Pseudonocardia sulfidoxydans]|uniref:hypothetical protein n=1 Tax=Pseudonocardia sulfidoxydans TaxID=54011 RepID=UPI00360F2BA5
MTPTASGRFSVRAPVLEAESRHAGAGSLADDAPGDLLDLFDGECRAVVLLQGAAEEAPHERGGGHLLSGCPAPQFSVEIVVDPQGEGDVERCCVLRGFQLRGFRFLVGVLLARGAVTPAWVLAVAITVRTNPAVPE